MKFFYKMSSMFNKANADKSEKSNDTSGRSNYINSMLNKINGDKFEKNNYTHGRSNFILDSIAQSNQLYNASEIIDSRYFAKDGYISNPTVFRCINIIAHTASSINLHLMFKQTYDKIHNICEHPICMLIERPNPFTSKTDFIENIIYNMMIFGGAFILKLKSQNRPKEIYVLDNSKVDILINKTGSNIIGYRLYNNDKVVKNEYFVNQVTGECDVLYIKNYNPIDNILGLSPLHAAAQHIKQHNNSVVWNNSLLRNSVRPSGTISRSVKKTHNDGVISPRQAINVRQILDDEYAGKENSGKALILNSDLQWDDLNMKPRDFDFLGSDQITTKHIANTLGVPIQLLGETGSSSYNNMLEAKRIFYENTILPLLHKIINNLFNTWLCDDFDNSKKLFVTIKEDEIPALSYKLEQTLDALAKSDFMTQNEKRMKMKLSPIEKL